MTTSPATMPDGLRLARTTPEFTDATVPQGLLNAHRVAAQVWGRLCVRAGTVRFVFEDPPGTEHVVSAGEHVDIPPSVAHRVVPAPGARFVVEFHTAAAD
jgi:tellurite resistance-related uncharacterized protein